jgi:hypothetical protein
MKPQLGKRLLAEQMKWDDTRATEEFAWLESIVGYKYDHYQGFTPGSRFFVSLLSWITQFEQSDRETAYGMIRDRLVFICQREMHHLVSLTFPRLQRDNRRDIADELQIPMYAAWGNEVAERRVKEMAIRTLYVGLSDGARTDVLRRFNDGVISNEQIVASTEISDKKWAGLIGDLGTRLSSAGLDDAERNFERICLVDDFTASGSSLIRKEKTGWDGKVPKFLRQIQDKEFFGKHIASNCVFQVHHFIGSNTAKDTINEFLNEFAQTLGQNGTRLRATFSTVLAQGIVVGGSSDSVLVTFLEKYYGSTCESKHTGPNIWFGYKQGGLPLVLEHNTPNNSVALLWAACKPSDARHVIKPLFPRKQRHVDHGQSV